MSSFRWMSRSIARGSAREDSDPGKLGRTQRRRQDRAREQDRLRRDPHAAASQSGHTGQRRLDEQRQAGLRAASRTASGRAIPLRMLRGWLGGHPGAIPRRAHRHARFRRRHARQRLMRRYHPEQGQLQHDQQQDAAQDSHSATIPCRTARQTHTDQIRPIMRGHRSPGASATDPDAGTIRSGPAARRRSADTLAAANPALAAASP